MQSRLKILSLVEATTINAVAKNVLEFHRGARELQTFGGVPIVDGSVATFERPGTASNEFVVAARAQSLDVDTIPERRRFDLKVIPALRAIVEQRRPDVVVTHSVKSHFLLLRSRLWKRFPWIAFHHGYTTTDSKMRLYNRFDRWSLPKADRVVTVCHAFARELASTTGVAIEKISVQHNSIGPQRPARAADVQALKSKYGIDDDERLVLSVGRLSREKAQADLLTSFQRLRELHPELNCKLILVGDGPERAKLESTAESLRLKDRIVFAGQINNVQDFYAAADVLALPSHSEGSPYVLLEAMAAGVPIVATAVGGVPEMVSDSESALLVPARDPEAMASAIARALSDEELSRRLTTNASSLITSRFSREKHVRSLVEIYRAVVAGR
jgi:glycosyltransferase involved in cell wall biosynthesis